VSRLLRPTRRELGAGLGSAIAWNSLAAAKPGAPATYFMFIFANPAPGREAEFNRFYDEVHAPQVLQVPGFVSVQRMVYNDAVQLREVPLKKPRYLAMYTIETDDLAGLIAENKRRLDAGEIRRSDSFDRTGSLNYLYRRQGPVVVGHTPQPATARPGPMQTYFQIVFGDPVPGREAEFNAWYEKKHDPELGNSPGWVLAERGVYSDLQYRPNPDHTKYVAIFEAITSDIAATIDARVKDPAGPPTSSDPARTFGYTYRALGPPIFAKR
jgi:hypothetical protein